MLVTMTRYLDYQYAQVCLLICNYWYFSSDFQVLFLVEVQGRVL